MKAIDCSDQELLQQYSAGSTDALEALVKRYERKVYTYILMLVRKPHIAEDLLQDTFIKVMKSLTDGSYIDDNKFVSWVLRIAHNLVIDHFRQTKKKQEVSNDDYESDLLNTPRFSENTIEQNLVYGQLIRDVRQLVDALPLEQREVVLLRYYADLSFKEIAEMTCVSINTALGRMRYAILNLRKVIEEKNLCLQLE